jgi:hypothetical protein
MILKVQQTASSQSARIAGASQDCAVADLLNDYHTDPGGNIVKGGSNSASLDGANVSLSLDSSGAHFGLSTTINGNTFTMKYDSGELSCLAYNLPPCPHGDGSLDAYGVKGKTGFSLTVAKGGQVLKSESYTKTITVETKGQVAEDAKLDYVDVKYGETTNIVLDGTRLTTYGNRTTRINMRTGGYDPGEATSFGTASAGGSYINTAGENADAKDFASFVSQTISAYRTRETAWQSPKSGCAKLKFDPQSGTLTLSPGDTGKLSAEVDATADGGRAEKASWTLSNEQNGSFSPTSSKDPQPSFSYVVSASPSGTMVSVSVKATSTAGVAQDTWSQKLRTLNTITGTFTGHATDLGVIYDWTGSATFQRIDIGTSTPGVIGLFQLTSGQATVTVSGSEIGTGCDLSGTPSTIGVIGKSPVTVSGMQSPFSYQIDVGFMPDPPQATYINCSGSGLEGTPAGLGSMPVNALQSGDNTGNPDGLTKTTDDLYTYSGSATADGSDPGETVSWNWSFTGTP